MWFSLTLDSMFICVHIVIYIHIYDKTTTMKMNISRVMMKKKKKKRERREEKKWRLHERDRLRFCPLHTDTHWEYFTYALYASFYHVYICSALCYGGRHKSIMYDFISFSLLFMCYTRLFQSEGERQFSNSKLIPCWSPMKYFFILFSWVIMRLWLFSFSPSNQNP